jgi:predicted nucleic acid-binding protein
MDELCGRALAIDYGLNVAGVLGVLLQAKRNGLIMSVNPLIDQLIEEADFQVSSQLYEAVLHTADEN